MSNHTQVKLKCMKCGLHFVICTWHPERHSSGDAYCPECGQQDGSFLMWHEESEKHIFQVVPGEAVFAGIRVQPDRGTESDGIIPAEEANDE